MGPTVERPILITGAAGFVGSYLIEELHRLGVSAEEIVGLVQGPALVQGVGRTFELDIRDRRGVLALIDELRPSAIVHLAAIAEPTRARSEPSLAWSVNVDGTRHLADAVMLSVPDARFTFAGSAEAYGTSFNDHAQDGAVSEDAPLKPTTAYGATKAVCDVMLSQMAIDGLRCIRFRAFNHTGPAQAPAYVVPAFARQIARIEAGQQPPVLKVGNLDAERDFLDVRDVVAAYALSVTVTDAPAHGVFNVSSGKPRTIRSILDALVRLCEVPITVETDPERMRPSEVPCACGDNSSLRRAFGWQQQVGFEETLVQTLNYWRATVV